MERKNDSIRKVLSPISIAVEVMGIVVEFSLQELHRYIFVLVHLLSLVTQGWLTRSLGIPPVVYQFVLGRSPSNRSMLSVTIPHWRMIKFPDQLPVRLFYARLTGEDHSS